MSILNIKNIEEIKGTDQLKNIYLVLFHPDKVPPHIGIIVHENYYSLKTSGVEITTCKALFRTLEIKKTPVLFMELISNKIPEDMYALSKKIFFTFQNVNEDVSCIEPIKLWFKEIFSIETKTIETLHQLIPALENNNTIKSKYLLNLSADKNGTFQLGSYGKEEVQLRIKQLSV